MPSPRSSRTWFWLLLAAGGMMALPPEMQAKVRLAVGDFVRPGCRVWIAAKESAGKFPLTWSNPDDQKNETELTRVRQELAAATQRVRQLEIQAARHQEAAAAWRPPLFAQSTDQTFERLAAPVLMDVAVLGEVHSRSWRKGGWLDQGKAAGMIEDAPILASSQPLLDVGRDAELAAEDALLLGRSVIGKVHQVGRWTSTFLFVTDAEYRGRAQLVRQTSDGFVFGAKGVLKGRGKPLCQLDGIPASETVEVGDSVYTTERDGVLPTPLYYGTVVEAELDDRGREWRIRVQPVERPADLTTIQVLRTSLNVSRAMAN